MTHQTAALGLKQPKKRALATPAFKSSKGGKKSAKTGSGKTGQGAGGGRKAGGRMVTMKDGTRKYVNPDDPSFTKLVGAKIADGSKPEAQASQLTALKSAASELREELDMVSNQNTMLDDKLAVLERKALEHAKMQKSHIRQLEQTLGMVVNMANSTLPEGKTFQPVLPDAPEDPLWLKKVETKVNLADAEALDFGDSPAI